MSTKKKKMLYYDPKDMVVWESVESLLEEAKQWDWDRNLETANWTEVEVYEYVGTKTVTRTQKIELK